MNFVTHQNGSSWTDVIDRKWWVNQREALRVVDHYLNQDTSRQAMVRMPTGTGKTVVIATLAQLVVDHPRCVIVAPWENLVQQIQREVATRVWEKVEEQDAITAKPTAIFTPSTFKQMLGTVEKSGTLLCTYQTLQTLQKHRTAFRALKQWATLALVDEGHREPAPRWAEAVRGLERPTVLFTATPYRNDLKLFDVARDAFYSFTFGEALSNHLVREVQFVEGTWSLSGSNAVGEFVDQLLATCASAEGEFGIARGELRAIVRCETAAEIRAITAAIQARRESVVGIHERFHASDGTSFRNEVPDPQTESAKYWVHQYKLLEGLDDPRFRLVAVHGAFKNARNLVQQVGRVIRNPTRQANQKAIVLTHRDQRQRRLWERFIEYEGEVFDRKGRGQTELAAFEDFLASRARAPKFYFLGDFRRHLQPEDVTDPRDVIRIRKSVLVLFPGDKFAWRTLVTSLKQELLVNDAIPYGSPHEEPGSFLQLFQVSEQSPLVPATPIHQTQRLAIAGPVRHAASPARRSPSPGPSFPGRARSRSCFTGVRVDPWAPSSADSSTAPKECAYRGRDRERGPEPVVRVWDAGGQHIGKGRFGGARASLDALP